MTPLGRHELVGLLDEVGAELRRARTTARIYLVGGRAMALAYDAERTTRDLDALVIEGHGAVMAAVQRVARRHQLPGSWLNEQAVSFMPRGDDPAPVVVFDSPGLTVLAASPRRLLAMKAMAARPVERPDIERLCELAGVSDMSGVETLVAELFPDQPLPPRSRAVLAELLG